MKYITYGIAASVMILFVIFAVLTVESKAHRQTDLSDALPSAIESAMEEAAIKGTYAYEDRDSYIADFTALLLQQLNVSEDTDNDFKLTVDIAGADEKKGLISVHVKADYIHPNGKKAQAEATRSAILETEYKKKLYTVSYYLYNPTDYPEENKRFWTNEDGTIRIEPLYYTYSVVEGEKLPVPGTPEGICYKSESPGELCWTDMVTNQTLDENEKVHRNMSFVAYPNHE